jgi:hypothetical protein
MKYLAYMNIVEIITCKTVEIEKRGDALRYHSGINNLIKKNPVENKKVIWYFGHPLCQI